MSTSRWGERLVRYPADLADRYRQAGLWGTRTIADELHAVAAAYPQRNAVVALDGRLTYRELDERTDILAAGLAGQGLAPGDPVLFQVTNRLGAVLAWYGVLKAGLVPVCTLAAHRGHEIGGISRRVGAVAHLVEAGHLASISSASPPGSSGITRPCATSWSWAARAAPPEPRSSRWAPARIRRPPARPSRRSSAGSTPTTWRSSSSPAARPECPR